MYKAKVFLGNDSLGEAWDWETDDGFYESWANFVAAAHEDWEVGHCRVGRYGFTKIENCEDEREIKEEIRYLWELYLKQPVEGKEVQLIEDDLVKEFKRSLELLGYSPFKYFNGENVECVAIEIGSEDGNLFKLGLDIGGWCSIADKKWVYCKRTNKCLTKSLVHCKVVYWPMIEWVD